MGKCSNVFYWGVKAKGVSLTWIFLSLTGQSQNQALYLALLIYTIINVNGVNENDDDGNFSHDLNLQNLQ